MTLRCTFSVVTGAFVLNTVLKRRKKEEIQPYSLWKTAGYCPLPPDHRREMMHLFK